MRTSIPRSCQGLVLLHAVGLLVALPNACKGPTEPPLRFVAPQLDSLVIEPLYTRLADGGVLVVLAAPSDTAFRIADKERLLLTATTSAGDEETFSSGRFICSKSRDCTGLIVTMEAGHSTSELAVVIGDLPARIYSASSTTAGVRVLEWDKVDSVMDMIRRSPSVRLVDRDALGCVTCTSLPLSWALGGVAIAMSSAVQPSDGILQVAPGHNISIRYRQPTVEILERTVTVP